MSINIHIIDKERRKYSAHFMMWLNSYGFHFIVVEIDKFNSKYCIFEIENNGNKIDAFTVYSKRTNAQWHRLKTKYKKAISRNKILARNLNNICEQFGL
ncbi:hypothetical protein NST18_12135 [Anoxybacillus sp. FSL W8-0104]|uniref:hypothetical protein n=1 Tax=Anoxybacillus sp. FSL W8-0104 TaxID=2954594 RepID=UPI0030F67F89